MRLHKLGLVVSMAVALVGCSAAPEDIAAQPGDMSIRVASRLAEVPEASKYRVQFYRSDVQAVAITLSEASSQMLIAGKVLVGEDLPTHYNVSTGALNFEFKNVKRNQSVKLSVKVYSDPTMAAGSMIGTTDTTFNTVGNTQLTVDLPAITLDATPQYKATCSVTVNDTVELPTEVL